MWWFLFRFGGKETINRSASPHSSRVPYCVSSFYCTLTFAAEMWMKLLLSKNSSCTFFPTVLYYITLKIPCNTFLYCIYERKVSNIK